MSKNLDKVMNNLKKKETPKQEVPEEETEEVEEDPEEDLDEELEDEQEETTEKTEADEEEVAEDEQEDPKAKADTPSTSKEKEKEIQEARTREIELLQNDGVFRQQLLIQLTEINKNLFVLNKLVAMALNEDDQQKPTKKAT